MPYDSTTVADTVEKLNRQYFLPAIQRPFVWKPEQVVALFDSLMKRYPISSFLFWSVAPENKPNWQVYKFAEHFRFGEVHTELAETDGRMITLVLDGQQRLTSLLLGLRGTLNMKAKGKRWDDSSAWQKNRLYLDLLVQPSVERSDEGDKDDIETPFGFALFDKPPKNEPGQLWIKVGDMLGYPGEADLSAYKESVIAKLPADAPRSQEQLARAHLDRLHSVIWRDKIISYFTETDQDYDRVLTIFVRANDGGTKLNKSDLMMSMISSKWTDIPAKEEINSFVSMVNERLGRRNKLSNDFVMKACLLLSDLDHVYKVANFTNRNLEIMRSNWDQIKLALKRTFLLANSFGIDRENLTSLNALLPIAYYLHKTNTDLLDSHSADHARNRENIRSWLIAALLTGAFGGTSDNTIGVAKGIITAELEDSRDFPVAELFEKLSRQRKRPTFLSDEVIDGLLSTKYGQRSVFLILSLLYEEKSWGVIPHDVDHIFPQAGVTRKALLGQNLALSRVEKIIEASARIGNLQLLTNAENNRKSAAEFHQWVSSLDDDYCDRHLIPADRQLWDPMMLPEFVAEREKLIRMRLSSLRHGVNSYQ